MSPGNVPMAKSDITVIPIQKLPVPMAYICIAKVNPQGRKNVRAPLPMIPMYLFTHVFFSLIRSVSFFPNSLPVGKLRDMALSFGDILLRLIPSNNITPPMINVITDMTKGERLITDQNNPSIPQSIPNQIILPMLNRT